MSDGGYDILRCRDTGKLKTLCFCSRCSSGQPSEEQALRNVAFAERARKERLEEVARIQAASGERSLSRPTSGLSRRQGRTDAANAAVGLPESGVAQMVSALQAEQSAASPSSRAPPGSHRLAAGQLPWASPSTTATAEAQSPSSAADPAPAATAPAGGPDRSDRWNWFGVGALLVALGFILLHPNVFAGCKAVRTGGRLFVNQPPAPWGAAAPLSTSEVVRRSLRIEPRVRAAFLEADSPITLPALLVMGIGGAVAAVSFAAWAAVSVGDTCYWGSRAALELVCAWFGWQGPPPREWEPPRPRAGAARGSSRWFSRAYRVSYTA
jgi:hypothetical protein